ncbi:MAG: hypothetical protein JNJ59_24475 [Deltaproteobacteria bacterium]|nr:hypothetical protein [Deltaproteobacteria bacterium]
MSPRIPMFSAALLLTGALTQCSPIETASVRLGPAEVIVTTCSQIVRLDVDLEVVNESDDPLVLDSIAIGRSDKDSEAGAWIEGDQNLTGTLDADSTETLSCINGFDIIRPVSMSATRWVTLTVRFSFDGEVRERSIEVQATLMQTFDNCGALQADPMACHVEE